MAVHVPRVGAVQASGSAGTQASAEHVRDAERWIYPSDDDVLLLEDEPSVPRRKMFKAVADGQ